jgi:tetratricopeptide (TPR) repeat protein
VDAYTVNLETDPTVLLWRAFSYNELGNTDASIADFDRAFKAGARDEASVETYVDVLLEDERADDAALFVEQYTAAGSSPRVLALQALVYVRSGDAGKLAKTLVDLEDPQHSNAEAALVAAMIRSQTEGLAALTSLTSRLAAVGLASPDLYLLRAGIEVKQKMLTEAQASIDEGLKLSPNHPDLLAVDAALKKALGDDL